MLGVILAVVFISVLLLFIFRSRPMIPETMGEEYAQIVEDLERCKTMDELEDNDQWFEDFMEFWAEEMDEEKAEYYKKNYHKLHMQRISAL